MEGIKQQFDGWEKSLNLTLDVLPDECPCCHSGIKAHLVAGFVHDDPGSWGVVWAQAVFRCPRYQCGNYFIGNYKKAGSRRPEPFDRPFELLSLEPKYPEKLDFPAVIQETSPAYCFIISQADIAETMDLLAVAGPGYGKALEFLVKDYLIKMKPTEENTIKKTRLGKLIKEKIDDAGIKECAKRATWLRNDETHYLRKWEGKDLDDLKTLIKLTQNWIENSLLKDKYLEEMHED